MDDRVRMNTLALATVTLSQSPCFWHAGADLLRSKSLDRNSYDSGDWFNRIDWTRDATRRSAPGLPPRVGQRGALAVHAAAARRPGAQAAAAPHPRPPASARSSCCASATRRRSSGSATPTRSAASCASSPARPA